MKTKLQTTYSKNFFNSQNYILGKIEKHKILRKVFVDKNKLEIKSQIKDIKLYIKNSKKLPNILFFISIFFIYNSFNNYFSYFTFYILGVVLFLLYITKSKLGYKVDNYKFPSLLLFLGLIQFYFIDSINVENIFLILFLVIISGFLLFSNIFYLIIFILFLIYRIIMFVYYYFKILILGVRGYIFEKKRIEIDFSDNLRIYEDRFIETNGFKLRKKNIK